MKLQCLGSSVEHATLQISVDFAYIARLAAVCYDCLIFKFLGFKWGKQKASSKTLGRI